MTTHADTQTVREQLGTRISQLRRMQGISQKKLGEMVGLDRTYILSIEHGRRNVGIDNLVKIAQGLGTSMPELFEDIDIAHLNEDE